MARLSLPLLVAALTTMVAGQEGGHSALPTASASTVSQLAAVSSPSGMACGGCHVVADVAGIVFGGVLTATATNVVGVGSNGTVVTTSVIENQGQATFSNSAAVTAGGATSFNSLNSVITVNGATLTSPTMYEVFTAFSVITTVSGASGCSVSTLAPSVLTSAYKYEVPDNADDGFLLSIENEFIKAVGYPECSAGGGQVQSTTHSMITTTTATSTSLVRPTPAAASTTFNFPNVTQPSIMPAMPTVTPATGEAARKWISASMVAFVVGTATLAWCL